MYTHIHYSLKQSVLINTDQQFVQGAALKLSACAEEYPVAQCRGVLLIPFHSCNKIFDNNVIKIRFIGHKGKGSVNKLSPYGPFYKPSHPRKNNLSLQKALVTRWHHHSCGALMMETAGVQNTNYWFGRVNWRLQGQTKQSVHCLD